MVAIVSDDAVGAVLASTVVVEGRVSDVHMDGAPQVLALLSAAEAEAEPLCKPTARDTADDGGCNATAVPTNDGASDAVVPLLPSNNTSGSGVPAVSAAAPAATTSTSAAPAAAVNFMGMTGLAAKGCSAEHTGAVCSMTGGPLTAVASAASGAPGPSTLEGASASTAVSVASLDAAADVLTVATASPPAILPTVFRWWSLPTAKKSLGAHVPPSAGSTDAESASCPFCCGKAGGAAAARAAATCSPRRFVS